MEAVAPPASDPAVLPDPAAPAVYPVEARNEAILAALRTALREPGEHRLFQTGKLPGLFASRHGTPADAARFAVAEGLLEVARTEVRGKQSVEWVRPTPKAVRFVDEHDSPKAVLDDLKAVIGETRAGVPVWLADTQAELAALRTAFDDRAAAMLAHLDALTKRVEAALRRVELSPPGMPESAKRAVPWGLAALEYLDRRSFVGVPGDCPLAELFRGVRDVYPALTLSDFHDGVRRLHDLRAIRLTTGNSPDAEFGLVVGAEVCSAVRR